MSNFLRPDEFLLLMNFSTATKLERGVRVPMGLPLRDRIILRDAGIQTAVEYPEWREFEPERGVYDFTHVDEFLRKNREAGMKTIMPVWGVSASPHCVPYWIPEDWYVRDRNGKADLAALSIWNDEAQDHLKGVYKILLERYTAPDVLIICGEYMNGEAILPCGEWFFDKAALESYKSRCGSDAIPSLDSPDTKEWLKDTAIQHLIKKQNLLYPQHKELWNMQQWLMNQWSRGTINYAQPDIMSAYKQEFPDASLVLFQYTYYDSAHTIENEVWVDHLVDLTGCDVIVEAHFPAGLKETTPKSILHGFRGQIVAPIHPQNQKVVLEDWMVTAIRDSINMWKGARCR